MKKVFSILCVALWLMVAASSAVCTEVSIAATQITNPAFNPASMQQDVTLTNVTVTNGSAAVTCSACLRTQWLGIGGFQISISGVQYVVATVTSTSALTLTTNYAAGSSTTATVIWYKYVELRMYADRYFIPKGAAYVAQPGTPGSGAWFKRVACSLINNGSDTILWLPVVVLPATTDATPTNAARFSAAFYRPDNSLVQFYNCFEQFRIPPTTPTTWVALCDFNSVGVNIAERDAYTKTQIDNRFPSCPAGTIAFYNATGNVQSCLTVGTGLSISGTVLNNTGGGGGSCPDLPDRSVQYNNNGVCGGEPEFLYQITSPDGGNLVRLTHATQETNLRLERTGASTIASIQLNSLGNAKFRRFETGSPAFLELASGRTGPAFLNSLDVLGRVDFIGSNAISFNPSARISAIAAENHLSTNLGTGLEISTTQNASSTLTKQVLINFLGTVNVRPATSTTVATTLGAASALVVGLPNTINADVAVQISSTSPTADVKMLVVQGNTSQTKAILELQNSSGTALYSVGAAGSHTYGGLTTEPPLSPADGGRIYFDSVLDKFRCSENASAYVNCVGGGGGSSPPFVDTTSIIEGSVDATKEIRFEVDGLTTGTIRVLTPPDANIVIAGSASALTSGRIPYVTTGGLLTDSSTFTWNNSTNILTASGGSAAVLLQGASPASSDGGFYVPFIGGSNSSGPSFGWGSSASFGSQSKFFLSNGLNFQGANSTHDPVKIRTGTGTSSDGTLIFEFRPSDSLFNFNASTGLTASRHTAHILDVTSTGTPADSFGGQIEYRGESSTTASQQMVSLNWLWTTAAHASRTSTLMFQTVDNASALTERMRVNFWGVQLSAVAFANLATPSNGTVAYCSDCTIANPCAGSGTGAIAKRLNSVWVCN